MKMWRKYTVDRIEEGIAVLLQREDESMKYNVPVQELPAGAKEGDLISAAFDGNKVIMATLLKKETEIQKKKVSEKIHKILNKD